VLIEDTEEERSGMLMSRDANRCGRGMPLPLYILLLLLLLDRVMASPRLLATLSRSNAQKVVDGEDDEGLIICKLVADDGLKAVIVVVVMVARIAVVDDTTVADAVVAMYGHNRSSSRRSFCSCC